MRVLQLMPAAGWTATFIDPETKMKGDSRPLVCWALLEDGSVAGMVADGKDVKPVTELHQDFSSYHCHGAQYGM